MNQHIMQGMLDLVRFDMRGYDEMTILLCTWGLCVN